MGKSVAAGVRERDGGGVRSGPTLLPVSEVVASPPAARAGRPRWRDRRFVLGVILILGCIVLGARVVAAADRSHTWVTVRADLPAGHVLVAGDLTTTSGRLVPAAAGRYFDGGAVAGLVGQQLAHPVSTGELLGRAALRTGTRPPTRVVPLVVKAGRLPDLREGDRVDVYVLARSAGSADPAGREVRVASAAEFLGSQELMAGSGVAVQVRVPASAAAALVAASQAERVDIVRVDPGAAGELGDPGAASTPAYGT